MNRKYLIILAVIFLVSLTAVSAQGNDMVISADCNASSLKAADEDTIASNSHDEKLEKTYYYDEYGDEYEDDTVVTRNVVKYYGDTGTKFKVKVYDDDYIPMEGVYVSFGKQFGKSIEKRTNANGVVRFSINYKPGTYDVETYIESEDGKAYWSAINKVKIKSTIPTKELVKYSGNNKKFKIKFLDTKGKPLVNTIVKFKFKGKKYKVKTDAQGIASIKSTRFKIGKTSILVHNPVSKETRKIPVVVLKKGIHKIKIRIDDPTVYFPTKKLKNGDYIDTMYETEYRQYNPGVYVELTGGGLTPAKHTKLIKAKFYFKNKITGKIITRTSNKVKYDTIKVSPINGYSPFRATVWYRDVLK